MPDSYRLTVTCSHQGRPDVTADTRTVTVITHHTPPTEGETFGFLEWRDGGNALRTQWGVLAELTTTERGQVLRDPAARAKLLTDRRTGRKMGGTWWRFRCSDCGHTLQSRGARLEPVLERLRVAGVTTIDLAHLRSVLL